MIKRNDINREISVGDQPTAVDLENLFRQGFNGIVNLRTSSEVESGITPDNERVIAKEHGLGYLHLPVSLQDVNHQVVDLFRLEIKDIPKPVYIHCASGMRAAAFAIMHLAVDNQWTSEEALKRAESQLGFQCDNPKMKELFKSYIDKHQEAGKGV